VGAPSVQFGNTSTLLPTVSPGLSDAQRASSRLGAVYAHYQAGRLAEALAHEGPAPGANVPRKLWHSSGGSAGR